MQTLDIIVPVFNEDACLEELFNRLCKVRMELAQNLDINFVFINDGSHDTSINILRRFSKEHTFVKVIDFSRHFGYQVAITAGIDISNSDYVVIMHADLEHSPETIIDMYYKLQQGCDIVYAKPNVEENYSTVEKAFYYINTAIMKKFCNLETFGEVYDFSMLTKPVISILKNMPEKSRYINGMIPWAGFSSECIEYDREKRFAGEQHTTFKAILKLTLSAIFSFSRKPLHIINYLALLLICMAVLSLLKLNMISAAILFSGSIQLLAMSILGTYIGRIYEEAKQRPLYVIKNKYNIDD